MPAVHAASVGAFFTVLIGYITINSVLQYLYYETRSRDWKIQPTRGATQPSGKWWLPALGGKKNRAPYHRLLCTLNLLIASLFAAFTAELTMRGHSKMVWTSERYVSSCLWAAFCAVMYEIVIEYYWHRMMHLPFFYKRLHKIHHAYKHPEPFDDLYVHPLEVAGYYCILYSPPFVLEMHLHAFFLYMVIMGLTGTLDHSGIRAQLLLYNSEDHDRHHEKFDVNYGFPIPLLDIVHGTYDGVFLGMEYRVRGKHA